MIEKENSPQGEERSSFAEEEKMTEGDRPEEGGLISMRLR